MKVFLLAAAALVALAYAEPEPESPTIRPVVIAPRPDKQCLKKIAAGTAFPCADGCNTCRCTRDGKLLSTRKFCGHNTQFLPAILPKPKPQTKPALLKPKKKKGGIKKKNFKGYKKTFKCKDGCNRCIKTKGGKVVKLTKMLCTGKKSKKN